MKCNVCNEEEIKSVFAAAKTQFGGIDVCINNAGLAHNAPLLTGETQYWRNILEVKHMTVVQIVFIIYYYYRSMY